MSPEPRTGEGVCFDYAPSEEFPDGEMERFAAEALKDMYFVATGQSIDVEFVDCPDSLDTAQKLARITSHGQRSATSASTMPGQKNAKQVLWNLGTHVRLCRQPLATPAY